LREKHFTKGKTNSPAGEQRRLVVNAYPGLYPHKGNRRGAAKGAIAPL